MKSSSHCMKVYLALFLLIVLVAVFPYKEGFDNDSWSLFDMSSWFRTKKSKDEEDETKNETKDVKTNNYDDTYGSGLLYTTTQTTNDASYNDFL